MVLTPVAAIIFLALFLIPSVAHTALVLKSRIWWMSLFVVGGVCEIVGWSGTLASHVDIKSLNGFLIQQIW